MSSINRLINKIIENKKLNFLTFLGIISVLTIYMLYINQPLYAGDDFPHHFGRLQGLIQALKDGNFPWYINYTGLSGAGYFVKAFYCDVTLLPFAIIGMFTNTTVAFYSMLVATTLLTGVFTYWAVYRVYNKNTVTASITGILFTFCSYRLLDLYFRAAIGEVFTFIFLPIVFWGLYEIIKGDYKKWYILAIGYTFIIYSHLVSSVMLVVPIVLFLIVYYKDLIKEPKRMYYLVVAGVATILLTLFYTIPMLEQMQSNTFYYETRDSIPETMGATRTISYILDGLFQGTVSHLNPFFTKTGVILTMFLFLRIAVRNRSKAVRSADFLVIAGVIILFMASNIFPWNSYPFKLLSVMQYPWRFYIFPSFFFALAGGIYASNLELSKVRTFFIIGLAAICSIFVIKSEGQNYTFQIGVKNAGTIQNISQTEIFSYGACEYLPDAVPSIAYLLYERKGYIGKQDESTLISEYKNGKGIISFDINREQNENIELPIIYYKGYIANINGKNIDIKESEKGLIELAISESGRVEVYYAATATQKVCTIISFISLIVLCIFIYWNKKKTRNATVK